jgi:post-segregation antitoxin (ccd killing protein)
MQLPFDCHEPRETSMTREENSVELEIKLTLPDSLVREAQASGLLTSQALENLLQEEVGRRRVG